MSYYAKVTNGIVEQVISAEADFIATLPDASSWIQTSYNTRGGIHYGQNKQPDGGIALRANYAGIGYTYNSTDDVFYAPQPYSSWTISAPTWEWQAPTPYPTDGKMYKWNETTLSWIEIE